MLILHHKTPWEHHSASSGHDEHFRKLYGKTALKDDYIEIVIERMCVHMHQQPKVVTNQLRTSKLEIERSLQLLVSFSPKPIVLYIGGPLEVSANHRPQTIHPIHNYSVA